MTILAFFMLFTVSAQTRWQLSVTIEVTRDVDVKPSSVLQIPGGGLQGEQRGTLYIAIGRDAKAFRIMKEHTFQMIKVEPEGGCQIRFENKDYTLGSCPWLDGFTDHQADIFKVIVKK